MAKEVSLDVGRGDLATVTKVGSRIIFRWPCGDTFSLTKGQLQKALDNVETVKRIKGARIPLPGLKFGRHSEDQDAPYMLEVNGANVRIIWALGEPTTTYGKFTVASLKKAIKQLS